MKRPSKITARSFQHIFSRPFFIQLTTNSFTTSKPPKQIIRIFDIPEQQEQYILKQTHYFLNKHRFL